VAPGKKKLGKSSRKKKENPKSTAKRHIFVMREEEDWHSGHGGWSAF